MDPLRIPVKTKTKAAVAAAILIILSQGLLPRLAPQIQTARAAPVEGSLIRIASNSTVYYVGRDGKRYVFPNESTYFSWYHNFDNVQIIGDGELASFPIGNLIPVRPNVRFVRFESEAKVYAVEQGGLLRWVPDEATFARLDFSFDQVVTLPDVFRSAYTDGPLLNGLPNGVAVRSGQNGSLYYIHDGVRQPITEEVLRLNRYFSNHIRVVSPEVIAVIPNGPSISGFEQVIAGRPDDRTDTASTNQLPEPVPTSTAPSAPRNFGASGGSMQVTLSWSAPSSGGAVANYQLYRAFVPIVNINGSAVTLIAFRSASTTSYSDVNLQASTTYYYAVRAVGYSETFSPYVTTSASTLRADATIPPQPPTNLVALGGNRRVTLSWTLSATAGVTNYAIYYSTSLFDQVNSAGVAAAATTSGSATGYTVTNLASSTLYYFGVRARGPNGLFGTLVVVFASTQGSSSSAMPVNPPTGFMALGSYRQVALSWALSNSPDVASYVIYRASSTINNPLAPDVITVATTTATAVAYVNTGLMVNTTYHYAISAYHPTAGYSQQVLIQATTDPELLDRVLQLAEPPDYASSPDGFQWAMDTMTTAVAMGINKFMVPTRYYQGLNDLDPNYPWNPCINHAGRFCSPYHQFLSYADTLRTPDGRPVKIILLSAKVTKSPMASSDVQLRGAIRLKQIGDTPYNFLSRLSQTSGTLPPPGQGETRAFITVDFTNADERDRLLRLTTNISGDGVQIRWYPSSWGTSKFREIGYENYQQALGTNTFDFPNPTTPSNQYRILIINQGTVPLNWEILGLEEVAPNAVSIRNQDADYFEWLGNTNAFTTYGYDHPRYALDETRTRFVNTLSTVWNEFSSHPSLIGLMGNGDEPHSMYWMPEDLERFQNAGHELADFEKAVASGQYITSQKPLMLFGDPLDPTASGISTGVYATNMAGGGFSDMMSRFSGSEPIDWVLWNGARSTSQISNFTSPGFNVYLMGSLYKPDYLTDLSNWVSAASALPAQQKDRIKGWYYYAEQRSHSTPAILQAAVDATPDHLQ